MSFKAEKILSLATQFEKKATSGISRKSNKSYLTSFDKLISKFGQSIDDNVMQMPEDNISGSRSVLHMPADRITGKVPGKSRFGTIDKTFQAMLGVNADGVLGPITQSALDAYKKSIGQTGVSNELAFEALKREPQYASRQAIPFDDNANTYSLTRNQEDSAKTIKERMDAGEAIKTV